MRYRRVMLEGLERWLWRRPQVVRASVGAEFQSADDFLMTLGSVPTAVLALLLVLLLAVPWLLASVMVSFLRVLLSGGQRLFARPD